MMAVTVAVRLYAAKQNKKPQFSRTGPGSGRLHHRLCHTDDRVSLHVWLFFLSAGATGPPAVCRAWSWADPWSQCADAALPGCSGLSHGTGRHSRCSVCSVQHTEEAIFHLLLLTSSSAAH